MNHASSPAPRAVGIALILIGVGATTASMAIPLDQYGRWGARVFPLSGSVALLVLGLAELATAHRQARPRAPASLGPVFGLLVLSVAYVWLIGKFGYLIATAFAAPAALWIFGVRQYVKLALAALLCPIVYHIVFFELLGVFPPLGEWFDLLDLMAR